MTPQGIQRILTGNFPSFFKITENVEHKEDIFEDTFLNQAIEQKMKIKYFGSDTISSMFSRIDKTYTANGKEMILQTNQKTFIYNNSMVLFEPETEWDIAVIDWIVLDNFGHIGCSN